MKKANCNTFLYLQLKQMQKQEKHNQLELMDVLDHHYIQVVEVLERLCVKPKMTRNEKIYRILLEGILTFLLGLLVNAISAHLF
ncbi:hypothetical protein [uncultured Faecalibaculum sp.]|uniref:hypothetical protein n=1 Tax=uncultured Faecalibaculum sp. TaxID=1729681 RepID=UPI0025EC8A3D|nr:hypothetical protein [uncultured Faecalibaculum sp.]